MLRKTQADKEGHKWLQGTGKSVDGFVAVIGG